MILPTPPAKGDSVLQWARNLTGYLRSLRPSSGPGIRIQHTPAGMAISTDTFRPTPATTVSFPWQGYPVPYEGTGNPPPDQWKKFRVRPGMVNNLPPENPNEIFTAASTYFSLEVNIGRQNDMKLVPLSHTVVPGYSGNQIITDDEGVPTKITVVLGYAYANQSTKTIQFQQYRNTSFSLYCVQVIDTCEKSAYSLVFGAG